MSGQKLGGGSKWTCLGEGLGSREGWAGGPGIVESGPLPHGTICPSSWSRMKDMPRAALCLEGTQRDNSIYVLTQPLIQGFRLKQSPGTRKAATLFDSQTFFQSVFCGKIILLASDVLACCTRPSHRRDLCCCSRKMLQFSLPLPAWEGHGPGGSLREIFRSLQFIIFRDVPGF